MLETMEGYGDTSRHMDHGRIALAHTDGYHHGQHQTQPQGSLASLGHLRRRESRLCHGDSSLTEDCWEWGIMDTRDFFIQYNAQGLVTLEYQP